MWRALLFALLCTTFAEVADAQPFAPHPGAITLGSFEDFRPHTPTGDLTVGSDFLRFSRGELLRTETIGEFDLTRRVPDGNGRTWADELLLDSFPQEIVGNEVRRVLADHRPDGPNLCDSRPTSFVALIETRAHPDWEPGEVSIVYTIIFCGGTTMQDAQYNMTTFYLGSAAPIS